MSGHAAHRLKLHGDSRKRVTQGVVEVAGQAVAFFCYGEFFGLSGVGTEFPVRLL